MIKIRKKTKKIDVLFITLKVALVIGGFILTFSFLQFLLSIHPPRYYNYDVPLNYGLEYENILFTTSDKIKIKGWLISSENANGTVIIGHGYPFDKGNILPVAKFLYPDYNLLFYDHRYFGESEGKITTVGLREIEDVKSAINFTHERFGKEEPIALYGFSLSASVMLMTKTEVNAIIADSAYANLEIMVKHIFRIFGPLKYPFVKTTNLFSIIFLQIHPKKVSPELAVNNSKIPIFVIHGEKDTQIPVENAYKLKKINPEIELWIVKNANHGQAHTLHKKEYENKIKDFLNKNMK